MKIYGNWALGITTAIFLFLIFVIANVIYFSGVKYDLVEKDYYEKGNRFQEQIEKSRRTSELKEPPKIIIELSSIKVKYPEVLRNKGFIGNIVFFRPSDSKMDFRVKMAPDDSLQQNINLSKIQKGLWIIKMDWKSGDSSYYFEEKIIL